MLANPARLSVTPASYDRVPPQLGEHTHEVLRSVLNLDDQAIEALTSAGVI